MLIYVLKFGGTSVANLKRIENVVKIVEKSTKNNSSKIILVVSAMSGVTNKLIKEFKKIKNEISDPEYDVIVSTGEQSSSALISSLLNKKKIQSRSLLGWQIPILTDGKHSKARIIEINSKVLRGFLGKYRVLVIAGFQGISEENRITTLGRGGSDTSAVAISYALGLKTCEIYTDVEGIFTSDPRIVKNAIKIDSITYEDILELASLGSKVLHPRSVELAMKYGIRIHVRSSFKKEIGTMVIKEESKIEKEIVTGITSSEKDAKITLKGIPDKPGIAAKIFSILARNNINVDMIVQNITDDGKFASLTFTVPEDDEKKAVNEIKNSSIKFKNIHSNNSICKISIVGVGMRSNVGVAQKMFETLADMNINIQVISTSEIKISVLIDLPMKRKALNALHDAYKLGK